MNLQESHQAALSEDRFSFLVSRMEEEFRFEFGSQKLEDQYEEEVGFLLSCVARDQEEVLSDLFEAASVHVLGEDLAERALAHIR